MASLDFIESALEIPQTSGVGTVGTRALRDHISELASSSEMRSDMAMTGEVTLHLTSTGHDVTQVAFAA